MLKAAEEREHACALNLRRHEDALLAGEVWVQRQDVFNLRSEQRRAAREVERLASELAMWKKASETPEQVNEEAYILVARTVHCGVSVRVGHRAPLLISSEIQQARFGADGVSS